MKPVTLTLTISRINEHQTRLEFRRQGKGDDLVESRADHFEKCFYAASRHLIEEKGGTVNTRKKEGSR